MTVLALAAEQRRRRGLDAAFQQSGRCLAWLACLAVCELLRLCLNREVLHLDSLAVMPSIPFHRQPGRPFAGTDRPLYGRGQAGLRPIARKK